MQISNWQANALSIQSQPFMFYGKAGKATATHVSYACLSFHA